MITRQIHLADNFPVLRDTPSGSIDLIYIDPPFNTGKTREHRSLRTVRSERGDRTGFKGRLYASTVRSVHSYQDLFEDYVTFLEPRLIEAHRVLAPHGTFYIHLDYREVHYCKVLLDSLFGRDQFLNEIIWAYDYGARTKKRWPPKHDNILVYAKDVTLYTFDSEAVDRIPYMAPGLVSPEKAAKGKLPTDTWWHTIVPTNSRERTGYPTQKPMGILRRIVQASSRPGGLVMDFFAGSGTTGAVCLELDRRFILVDDSLAAMEVMAKRFADRDDIEWFGFDGPRTTRQEGPASRVETAEERD